MNDTPSPQATVCAGAKVDAPRRFPTQGEALAFAYRTAGPNGKVVDRSDWSPARLAADAAERAELEARQFPRFDVPTWRIHL